MSKFQKIIIPLLLFFLSGLMNNLPASDYHLPPVSDYDGYGNNYRHPTWGTPGQQFLRKTKPAYGDGISTPAGANRPSARAISNLISAQGEEEMPEERNMAAYIYTWGQFIDHDLDITMNSLSKEAFDIPVPMGDLFFDPNSTGVETIKMSRSLYDLNTGMSSGNPRQQVNQITAFLDGSMIYGSDKTRANALRTHHKGLLKSSPGNLMPLNNKTYFPTPLANDNNAHVVPDSELFVAGDVRANENVELIAVHTLFMREHNLWAKKIAWQYPELNDEQIYQYARAMVRAELQSITYNEWLPTLLGSNCLPPYKGYNRNINPGINNEFSTAALRIGHTLLASDIQFFDNNANEVRESISLKTAFYNPTTLKEVGIDPVIKYLATANASKIDTLVIDDIRNFLFGKPGSGGLDLASLNIQRGRDHGLADYNSVRVAYNLPALQNFDQITTNESLRNNLKNLYGDINNIDIWVGGLAESPEKKNSVGPLFTKILVDQFTRLRDGDRYWYEYIFSGDELRDIENTNLVDIIKRNTKLTNLQKNVFIFNASISGSVYFADNNDSTDFNCDLKDIKVWLIDKDGEIVDTVMTDKNGKYHFDSIHEAGPYKVKLEKRYESTSPNPLKVQVSRGGEVAHRNFEVRR